MSKRKAINENEPREIEQRTHIKKNLIDLSEEREKVESPTLSLILIKYLMNKNLQYSINYAEKII